MKCPICRQKVTDTKYKPFCSKRCADIDLGNWFVEKYVVEGNELVSDEDFEEISQNKN